MKVITKNFKNNKFLYYLNGFISLILPKFIYRNKLDKILSSIPHKKLEYIIRRVNYYNKIDKKAQSSSDWERLSNLKIKKKGKTYFFDTYSLTKYFSQSLKANFLFGDINYVPSQISFVKSRPINLDNHNSILLKLNKVRHFLFINDNYPVEKKKNILFGRAAVHQKQRIEFYKKYFDNELCDLGQINKGTSHDQWYKKKVSLDYHLRHKFILCIEGNEPKFESWFMEAILVPDYHYIHIKDDYSDLEKKLKFYIKNPEKLKQISINANNYVNQFRDSSDEKIISLLVMEKFFAFTNQKKSLINFLS